MRYNPSLVISGKSKFMALILITDDTAFARRMVKKAIKEDDHKIIEASNGQECLEMVATNSPDCILLDLLMPELDGFGVLKELQKKGSKIPVIVLSADIQDTTRTQCEELGAFMILQKPPKPLEIIKAISEALKAVENKVVNLTDKQLDILTELINIGIGQGAKMLNEMIESQINLQVPFLKLLAKVEVQEVLRQRLGYDKLSSIQLDFKGYFAGSAKLVFPRESAANLVAVLTGKNLENADLDIVQIGTLTEVGNIVINGVMGSLGNKLYKQIYYDVPCYAEEDIAQLVPMEEPNNSVLLAQAKFDIEDLQITGDIILFFKVGSFDGLLSVIEDLD